MTAQPLYTTEILRLAASLPVETRLPAPTAAGERRSPTCGSVIRTQVVLDGEGRVADLAQQVQACAFGQASAALVQQLAPGRSREELKAMRDELGQWLAGKRAECVAFTALAPARSKTARHGAILLPLDALLAALEEGEQ